MTKAQQTYERVEALVASGVAKAEAFRQVADEYGQPFNSIRGAYYAHSRSLNPDAPPRTRRRETTPTDPLEQARLVLNRAIDAIDADVEAAKQRADEAKAEYQELRDSAEARKVALKTKVQALDA
jgi:hypothetical protein